MDRVLVLGKGKRGRLKSFWKRSQEQNCAVGNRYRKSCVYQRPGGLVWRQYQRSPGDPEQRERHEPAHDASLSAAEPAPQLLIVEDDPSFAKLLCQHFAEQGLRVRHTAFAEQALEWCRASAPGMLLLDIHLAGVMDGWDLLLVLKQDDALQRIPIVVMVGSDPDVHGLAMGGADYALKSASRESLVQAVHRQIPDLEGKHILVADDDSVFRARIARFLRSEHAWVEEVQNGSAALERMAERIPDLLILDLLMPGMDGFEVLRRLRQDRRAVNLRTLVITAKNLRPPEKAYLHRRLASLVGKGEADLEYFSQIVNRTLKTKSQEEVPLSAGQS